MTDAPDEMQCWTAERKAAVVMRVVKGKTSAAEAAPKHGLTVGEIERWKERFLAAGKNAPRTRPKDEEAAKDEQIGCSAKSVSSSQRASQTTQPPRRRARGCVAKRRGSLPRLLRETSSGVTRSSRRPRGLTSVQGTE